MTKRKTDRGESETAPDRASSRTFCRDDAWYFASREGDLGPYESEAEAVEAMEAYVQLVDLRPENETPLVPDDEPEQDLFEARR